MQIIQLTSLDHPGLDVYARLTEAQLRRRLEPEQGVFIAESPKVIATALDAGCRPVSLLMERRWIEGGAAEILARCPADTPVYTGDRALLARLTGYELTRGVLCAMHRPAPRPAAAVLAGARRVAVLENIVDAANVGAVFRSAAALGMDGMLLSPGCCDPLCRRAVRVSMGAVLQLPWARLGPGWPGAGLAALPHVTAVTGLGLMVGVAFADGVSAAAVRTACERQGLLVLTAKTRLRLLPPLILTQEDVDKALAILRSVLESL